MLNGTAIMLEAASKESGLRLRLAWPSGLCLMLLDSDGCLDSDAF